MNSFFGNQTPIFFKNLNFGVNGINANDLMKKFLREDKKEVSINDFDNKYIISDIYFQRDYDYNKLNHKT